jgi:hypothetical protein
LYKLFLTLRYLRKRRIAYFAIAAVTLCVAMVLVVLSVMGGWLDMIKTHARGLLGDIIIDNSAMAGFPLYQEFIDEIQGWKDERGQPLIEKATPVLYTAGILSFPSTNYARTVQVVGIRLNEVFEVNGFKQSLFYDTYYPGTTNLKEQRKPLLGVDDNPEPVQVAAPDGGSMLIAAPVLPPAYREALEKARRVSGVKALADNEVASPTNKELLQAGLTPMPGYYEWALKPSANGEAAADIDEPRLDGPAFPGIIFGLDIVAQRLPDGKYDRSYPRGERATLTLIASSIRGQVDPIPIKPPFRYADDSRTGVFEIDSQYVYCDFELRRRG